MWHYILRLVWVLDVSKSAGGRSTSTTYTARAAARGHRGRRQWPRRSTRGLPRRPPTSRKGDNNAAAASAFAGGSNFKLFSELEAIYKLGSSGQCQHAFLILTTSKGKDRKEHDLLRHEAEFITFVSQVATAACEELVPYDGGGKENSSTPFTSSILVCIQSFFF